MYDEELNRIIDASRRNALTFFVGAGVSRLSGAPTWKELINDICDEIGIDKKKDYSSDEYLRIPQMFFSHVNKDEKQYYSFVEKRINRIDIKPNEIHKRMLDLNPVSFVTTNYDSLLSMAAIQNCKVYKTIVEDKEVPNIYGDSFILKIHGDFSHRNIVLKEEDYLNYSDNHKLIETLLKGVFSTNTVVFIGYSINDYNIKLILNWTKKLLQDQFQNPIFLYSDPVSLNKEELLYQESRGLSVIQCKELLKPPFDYILSYKAFFDAINQKKLFDVDKNDEKTCFDYIYEQLKPLDSLSSLRINDVQSKLNDICQIDAQGAIRFNSRNEKAFKLFCKINSNTNTTDYKKTDLEKYKTILSVFRKARIVGLINYENNNIYYLPDDKIPFADMHCILFDYKYIRKYVAEEHKNIQSKFKRAFYLYQLKDYEQSYYSFLDISKAAFENKNYLLYYFAAANCESLFKIIKSENKRFNCYDYESIKANKITETDYENLFSNLPVEFKVEYKNLENIHSVKLFYEYFYKSIYLTDKLEKVISTNTVELGGVTSSMKVINQIKDYLHFLLGNGLIADEFVEYRKTMVHLMTLIINKYSTQGKKRISNRTFGFNNIEDTILLDELDFYCLAEYFTDKDILELLSHNNIEQLVFSNSDKIELAINNLIHYYSYLSKTKANIAALEDAQRRIKNCLVILSFVNVPQELVDNIVKFILSNEFSDLRINDKVLFLDRVVFNQEKNSDITKSCIENALIKYIDMEISATLKGETFKLVSTSKINYQWLVRYIDPHNEKYHSKRLSTRVAKIYKNNLTGMYSQVIEFYFPFISTYQKRNFVGWLSQRIYECFSMKLFKLLIQCNLKIDNRIIEDLKEYVRGAIESQPKLKEVPIYPVKDKYEELNNVGFWCFIGLLNKNDFVEFKGISDYFDFYYEYNAFDFSKFQVSWLLEMNKYALEKIAKGKKVRGKIRAIASEYIKSKTINDGDRNSLKDILITYLL